MKLDINILSYNFLVFFIALYFCQGVLYPSGFILGKISVLIIITISCFYMFKTFLLKKGKSVLLYSIVALIFINTLGFLFEGQYNGIYISQYRNILLAMLPFFPFYYYGLRGYDLRGMLVKLLFVMLPIAILSFYTNKNSLAEADLYNSENFVSNTGYFFVALMPCIFLLGKKRFLSIILFLIILFFIIQSAKRGALIAALICSLMFFYYQFKMIDPRKRLQEYIISILVTLILLKFSFDLYFSSDFLVQRMSQIDEGGSGRNIIYENLWNNWNQSNNIINYIFGFGFVSTILYSGTGHLAHNDWLELLTNFGLIGVSIYIIFFISIFYIFFSKKIDINLRLMLLSVVLMGIFQTLFSMLYTTPTTMFFCIYFAYISSQNIIVKKFN